MAEFVHRTQQCVGMNILSVTGTLAPAGVLEANRQVYLATKASARTMRPTDVDSVIGYSHSFVYLCRAMDNLSDDFFKNAVDTLGEFRTELSRYTGQLNRNLSNQITGQLDQLLPYADTYDEISRTTGNQ